MNTAPNALAPHSGGPALPYIIVGFGDDSWGLQDGRTGDYALVEGRLRLYSKASSAEALAARLKTGPSTLAAFGFGPLYKADGTTRDHDIL